jgi:hypothetical protein
VLPSMLAMFTFTLGCSKRRTRIRVAVVERSLVATAQWRAHSPNWSVALISTVSDLSTSSKAGSDFLRIGANNGNCQYNLENSLNYNKSTIRIVSRKRWYVNEWMNERKNTLVISPEEETLVRWVFSTTNWIFNRSSPETWSPGFWGCSLYHSSRSFPS